MPHFPEELDYSDKYHDDLFEYRHIALPEHLYNKIKHKQGLLTEDEWRSLGIEQSRGWEHYATFQPDPNVLHFRRPLGTNPSTGEYPQDFLAKKMKYEQDSKNNLTFEAEL